MAPLGTGGSNRSRHTINNSSSTRSPTYISHRDRFNSNTSIVKAGQARTGEVPVRGTRTRSRRKIGRDRIRTPVAAADISHGYHTPAAATVHNSCGRRCATHASPVPEYTHLKPAACTTPSGIPQTYADRKPPSRESTPLTPAQVVTGAAR